MLLSFFNKKRKIPGKDITSITMATIACTIATIACTDISSIFFILSKSGLGFKVVQLPQTPKVTRT
jgi:hypothetical protein